jgi:hypothetical protein
MAITRENNNNDALDQGFIISPSFIEFSKAILRHQYGGYLPSYAKHPEATAIELLIEEFSEKSIIDPDAHDPRNHSFNVAVWNDFSLGYAYLVIAFEYIRSLGEKTKNNDSLSFKARLSEAFDSQFTRKEKIIVIDMSPFFPLSTEVLLEFVIPHVLALQARKFLKEYVPEELSKLELSLQSQVWVEQVRKILFTCNAKWTDAFYEGFSRTKEPALRRELFRDVAQQLWRECYPQATLQFSNATLFMQHIAGMFVEGGSLYERYTKPLSHQYKISAQELAHDYFPVLVSQFAREKTLSPAINQTPVLAKSATAIPVAEMRTVQSVKTLEKNEASASVTPKDSKSGAVNKKALDAAQFKAMLNATLGSPTQTLSANNLSNYMQEGYVQSPQEFAKPVTVPKAQAKGQVESASEQLQKVSSHVMRFFSRQLKAQLGKSAPNQNINSHPSLH